MDITLQPGTAFAQPVPSGHTAAAYVFEGGGRFGPEENAAEVTADCMIIFGDGDEIQAAAAPGSHLRFMFIAGRPFGEPIVPYGPFVMNTPQEIQQALTDLRNGTFVS